MWCYYWSLRARLSTELFAISMLLKGTLPVSAGTADARYSPLLTIVIHWPLRSVHGISRLWICWLRCENIGKWVFEIEVIEMCRDRHIRQTKRKLVSKKSVSNADACCHGDWGQWMVAMELATWNSEKGICWCVCTSVFEPVGGGWWKCVFYILLMRHWIFLYLQ